MSFLLINLFISIYECFSFIGLFFIDIKLSNYVFFMLNGFILFNILNYVIYLLCFKKFNVFKVCYIFILTISFIFSYYSYKYSTTFDIFFITNALDALGDAGSIIDFKDIVVILIFMFLSCFGLWKITCNTTKYNTKFILGYVIALIILNFVFSYSYKQINLSGSPKATGLHRIMDLNKHIFNKVYCFKFFALLGDLVKNEITDYTLSKEVNSFTKTDIYRNTNNKVKVLLVISDSIRSKSMQMSGYKVKNNPLLAVKVKNQKAFLLNQKSCNTFTLGSVSCMLSLEKGNKFRKRNKAYYKYSRIVKYSSYLGMESYLLYNNYASELYFGYKNVPISVTRDNSTIYDNDVVKALYPVLDKKESQFITLLINGAHIPYDNLLEDKFKRFDNNYDNKILQTDYVWNSIIEYTSKLNYPVFIIFTPDHGESFGEIYNGKLYTVHGADYDTAPPEQTHVPMLIYVNDSYKKHYKNNYENLIRNIKKYSRSHTLISADVISHSLLGCAGVVGNLIDKDLNLCSSH